MNNLMKLSGLMVLLAGLMMGMNSCAEQENKLYGTGEWDFPIPGGRVEYSSLGTQRALVKVNDQKEVVHAHIPWRRRDFEPENVEVLIYDAASGKQILMPRRSCRWRTTMVARQPTSIKRSIAHE